MSDRQAPRRMLLIGATGLVGSELLCASRQAPAIRLTALSRREAPLPDGARMEMIIADPSAWPEAIADLRPDVLACALGTTWAKSGRDEVAFRAIEHDLVLACGEAAARAGVPQMIAVTSIGADPNAKSRYLRTKGEVERALSSLDFARLDILRPSLLRGARRNDPRSLERMAAIASPIMNLFLGGGRSRYRAIDAAIVARAMLALPGARPDGRFVHEYDAIRLAVMRAGARRALVPGESRYGN